jgi:type IV secretory pathway VirB4 component
MSSRRAERPGHRCTTRHAQAIYPFVNAGGLGGRGVFIGRDSGGGAFCFDPWVLYREGVLDDPNVIVLGKLGQGKSALVKTLLWRMLLFGRRAFVLDIKREYGPLCRAVGVNPISLVPGGGVRLNPLASRPEEHAQLELLRAVTVTALGGPLVQLEAGALREALRVVRDRGEGEPTLPLIAAALFCPTAEMAQHLRTTPTTLARDCRRAALALQDLCEGPLRGMFDGPTTPGLDLDARLLVLDLHAVRDSPAVGILMACATGWLSALLARTAERPGRERLINVADESWKIVQHTGLGEWFQSNFKLAPGVGVKRGAQCPGELTGTERAEDGHLRCLQPPRDRLGGFDECPRHRVAPPLTDPARVDLDGQQHLMLLGHLGAGRDQLQIGLDHRGAAGWERRVAFL